MRKAFVKGSESMLIAVLLLLMIFLLLLTSLMRISSYEDAERRAQEDEIAIKKYIERYGKEKEENGE